MVAYSLDVFCNMMKSNVGSRYTATFKPGQRALVDSFIAGVELDTKPMDRVVVVKLVSGDVERFNESIVRSIVEDREGELEVTYEDGSKLYVTIS